MAGRMELEHLLLSDAAARLKCSEEHLLLLGAEGKIELLAQISDCPLERGGSWSGRVILTQHECARLAKRRDKFAWIVKIQDGDEVLAVPFENQRAIITREDVLVSNALVQSLGDDELSDRTRVGYELTIKGLVQVVCRLSAGGKFQKSDGTANISAFAAELNALAADAPLMGYSTLRERLARALQL